MSTSVVDGPPARPRTSSVRVAWRLLRCEPVAYVIAWFAWVLFWMVPIPVGLLLKRVLDSVGSGGSDSSVWAVLAVLAAVEVARWVELVLAAVQWHGVWVAWHTVPRMNVLRSLAVEPGPTADRLPGSPGDAVSRFRDDCQDLAFVLDAWLDVSGAAAAATSALVIMAVIDVRATMSVTVPIVAVLWLCHWLGPKLRAWRRTARQATAGVTSFVGDTFGAITAIKAAGAEAAVERRFAELGTHRARAERRDQVGTQLVQTLSGATGNLGIGLVLLLIAPDSARVTSPSVTWACSPRTSSCWPPCPAGPDAWPPTSARPRSPSNAWPSCSRSPTPWPTWSPWPPRSGAVPDPSRPCRSTTPVLAPATFASIASRCVASPCVSPAAASTPSTSTWSGGRSRS
ncbi:MAG: ABC transporter transmembrane domain-containing protein [Acidimicrobiales bacterium]